MHREDISFVSCTVYNFTQLSLKRCDKHFRCCPPWKCISYCDSHCQLDDNYSDLWLLICDFNHTFSFQINDNEKMFQQFRDYNGLSVDIFCFRLITYVQYFLAPNIVISLLDRILHTTTLQMHVFLNHTKMKLRISLNNFQSQGLYAVYKFSFSQPHVI